MITMDFRIIKFDCYETCLHYDIHQTCTFKYAYNYLQQPQKKKIKLLLEYQVYQTSS